MVGEHQAQFRAYGTSFGIRATDAELLDVACTRARILGWRESSAEASAIEYGLLRIPPSAFPSSSRYTLTYGADVVRTTAGVDSLIEAFEDHAKIETAVRANGVLFVHAGVVAWHGRAIVIPGRSHAGKSTLVHALMQAGAHYYSDDFALLDADGRVHPYPLPLSLRADHLGPSRRLPVDTLGPIARPPIFVDHILATEYRRGARWRPRPLSKSEALLVLMENTVAARQPPARTMPILRQAVLRARAWRTPRGDVRRAARQLIALLSCA